MEPRKPAEVPPLAERCLRALAAAGLVSAEQCWLLWRERQRLAGSDTDGRRARLAVESHLERIAKHRPLDSIAGEAERRQAEDLRSWFRQDFLDALG